MFHFPAHTWHSAVIDADAISVDTNLAEPSADRSSIAEMLSVTAPPAPLLKQLFTRLDQRRGPLMPDPVEAVIHIHEDDWGMRNLLPAAARAAVSADVAEAARAAERHRAPDGLGWTSLHLIESPTMSYVEAELRLADAASALATILPRVRRFYATIGSAFGRGSRDPLGSYDDEAWCFGLGRDCYIKLDSEGDLVRAIWFDWSSSKAADGGVLRRALESLDRLIPSFIADYHLHAEGDVSDATFLDAYFQVLAASRPA